MWILTVRSPQKQFIQDSLLHSVNMQMRCRNFLNRIIFPNAPGPLLPHPVIYTSSANYYMQYINLHELFK